MLTSLLIVLALAAALWLALVVVLALHRPSRDTSALLLRLVPDIGRLTFRLMRDPLTPRRYRVALIALGAYLALPIDLVPDFLPGIGQLDDVIVAAIVLGWVARGIGSERLQALWPGTPEGLNLLRRAIRAS